ncbi:MAG: hypothetical protein RL516_174 [Bacteroidota bacterium]
MTASTLLFVSCNDGGFSGKSEEPSIVGTYENIAYSSGSKIEIKADSTYIKWECKPDMSGVDLQTADPNAEIPMKCTEVKRGKWTLEGTVLHIDDWPYKFGVKPDRLYYNDTMYGKGTIEWTKR